MKSLEERLGISGATPSRPLSTDFTVNVMAALDKGAQAPKRRPQWKEYIQVKFTRKSATGLAVFLATLAVGGSAYAAVGGISGIRALFGGQKTLSDGSRIVTVHTQDCPHVDAFNIVDKERTANGTYYYKINADSKLTNAQVVHMVQGYCEADAESVVNGKAVQSIEARPENKNKLVGNYGDSVITALTPTTISLRSDESFRDVNNKIVSHTVNQAFGHIDPHAVVINRGKIESFSTLRVGDHVAVEYRATGDALSHSETIAPDQIDYSAQTVVIAIRVSQHMSEYYDYTKYNSKDFTQVVPCSKTAIGYCTVDQY